MTPAAAGPPSSRLAEPASPVLGSPRWPALDDQRAAALRMRWFRATTARAWLHDLDWWHPACDAVLEALVADHPVEPSLRRLGAVRSELGCTVEEAVDDVLALWDAHASVDPPARALRALVGGWAETGLEPVGAAGCADPVTGLATRSHLQSRLGEVYRDPAAAPAAADLVVVVLDLCFPPLESVSGRGTPEALSRVTAVCRAAEVVRRAFPRALVHARLAPTRVAALSTPGEALNDGLAAIEALLDGASGGPEEAIATWWVESLPAVSSHLPALLTDLSR